MPYIEGVGDELLFILIFLVAVVFLTLVWATTHVNHPRISVILVHGHADRIQNAFGRIRNAGIRIINLNRLQRNNTVEEESNETNGDSNNDATARNDVATVSSSDTNTTENTPNSSPLSNETDGTNETPAATAAVASGNISTAESKLSDSIITKKMKISSPSNILQQVESENINFNNANKDKDSDSASAKADMHERSMDEVNVLSAANANSADGETSSEDGTSADSNVPADLPEKGDTAENSGLRLRKNTSAPSTSQSPDLTNESSSSQEGNIKIKLKYLDDRQRTVEARPQQTVGEFKRCHFARELAENLMVRLIHNGRELRPDTNTLQAYNLKDSSVIHCLMSQNMTQDSNRSLNNQEDDDLNVGRYIFPLFGLILGLIWYSRVNYGRYFNAMSTLSLIGITFMYVIALLASMRTPQQQQNPPEQHADGI